MAQHFDYDPFEALMIRRQEIAQVIAAIDSGELLTTMFQDPQEKVSRRLRGELAEIDMFLMPFVHPKLSAQKTEMTLESKSLADFLRERAASE